MSHSMSRACMRVPLQKEAPHARCRPLRSVKALDRPPECMRMCMRVLRHAAGSFTRGHLEAGSGIGTGAAGLGQVGGLTRFQYLFIT